MSADALLNRKSPLRVLASVHPGAAIAAIVLGAIACGEAEIVGQAVPDVVTVQQVGHMTGFDERPLDGHGDG